MALTGQAGAQAGYQQAAGGYAGAEGGYVQVQAGGYPGVAAGYAQTSQGAPTYRPYVPSAPVPANPYAQACQDPNHGTPV